MISLKTCWRPAGCLERAKGSFGTPLLLLACVLLVVSASSAQDKDPAPNGTYRRPLGNDPGTMDPARINNIYSLSVTHQIFDGLVRFDHTLTISPALAQHWRSSRDGLTWTFTLQHSFSRHGIDSVEVGVVTSAVTFVLVSRLTPPPPEKNLAIFFDRDEA